MPPRRRRRASITERIADEIIDRMLPPATEVFTFKAETQTRVVLESGAPVMYRRAALALEPGDVLELRIRKPRG